MYRIAIHEASNRRRWFFRHKVQELSIEPAPMIANPLASLRDRPVDATESPFEPWLADRFVHGWNRCLQELPERYRTAVVLRDIEGLSYEEIAEMTETSLGTVKSRLVRGREALRKRLERYAHELSPEAGTAAGADGQSRRTQTCLGESGDRGHAMNCTEARQLFSPMLDSMLDGHQMHSLDRTSASAKSCSTQYAALRRTKWLMATMAPHQAPFGADGTSQGCYLTAVGRTDEARAGRAFLVRWENVLNAFMFPAAAGLLSAVLIFGLLIGVLVPAHLSRPQRCANHALHSARNDLGALRPAG